MGAGKKDARDRQKEQEKGRKKRGSRKYGQAKMKHSRMGIYSCVYAGEGSAFCRPCWQFWEYGHPLRGCVKEKKIILPVRRDWRGISSSCWGC